MKKRIRIYGAALLAVAMTVSFVGCGNKTTDSKSSATTKPNQTSSTSGKLDQIKSAKKLVLGTSADYAPYEFHKLVDGKDQVVGFDIEIAKEVAKDLGVELKIQEMNFDGLLGALDTNNVDMVIAGMSPTPERAKNVDFSKIYYTAQQGVIIRAEDKDKIKSIADLKGKKIGVQKGSIQETLAKEQMPDSSLVSISKIPQLVLELKSKKVDALVVELPVANGYVNKQKDLVISQVQVKDETGGSAIAFKKGSKDLVDAVNTTIDRLIKDKKIDQFVSDANEMVEQQ